MTHGQRAKLKFGAIYENAIAQELRAHGFELFYYNNKKQDELDFLIEYQGKVLPLEIKSGKDYTRHLALNHVLEVKNYNVEQAMVFCNDIGTVQGKIKYIPVYFIMFLEKEQKKEDMIYAPDFSILQ